MDQLGKEYLKTTRSDSMNELTLDSDTAFINKSDADSAEVCTLYLSNVASCHEHKLEIPCCCAAKLDKMNTACMLMPLT